MIEIAVESGVAKGQWLRTESTSITMGRGLGNDIVIQDADVSRHHGEITLLEDVYAYKDLNSTHGTKMVRAGEASAVHEVTLRAGDKLVLGNSKNILLVVQVGLADAPSAAKDVTILHSAVNRLVYPEDFFATDTKSLRAIVEFDTRLTDTPSADEKDLLGILLEYVPRMFAGVAHAAVIEHTPEAIKVYADLAKAGKSSARTSSTILRLAGQEHKCGLVYEVKEGSAIVAGQAAGVLSKESVMGPGDAAEPMTGICLPLDEIGLSARYLIFERRLSRGVFTEDDLGLTQALAHRVMGRVENNRLIRDKQRMSVNASLGVFAAMIGHDIKNYLFYSKSISDVHLDLLLRRPEVLADAHHFTTGFPPINLVDTDGACRVLCQTLPKLSSRL